MAMKREKQYDMFDVATGACTLDVYLFQRYSENDLSSTFWVDEKDEVDELRAPRPEDPPGIIRIIPIQGPRAPRKTGPSQPPPLPVGLQPEAPPGPTRTDHPRTQVPVPLPPDGQDILQKGGPEPGPSLESFQARSPSSTGDSGDHFQRSEEADKEEESSGAQSETILPPSMQDLLDRFHQATREYQERTLEDPPESPAEGS